MRYLFAAAVSLAAVPCVASAQATFAAAAHAPPTADATLRAAVDSIAGRARRFPVAGLTIGVSRGGRPVHVRGYGLANVDRRVAADAETVYEIGSITKQFTAAAVLRLSERGALRLDDTVGTYLPALAARAPGVTLRHLLTHTSGLSSARVVRDLSAASSPALVVDSLAARPVEFAPGARFRYNNNGYALLGLVVERVAGRPWAEYVGREFLEPLGLRATAVCAGAAGTGGPRAAAGYEYPARGADAPVPVPAYHPSTSFSAGSLCSTAGDVLRWQHALAHGRVVTPASYRLMTAPTTLVGGKQVPYGFAAQTGAVDGADFVSHGGASPGFAAQAAYYPAQDVAVVVLTNGIYAPSLAEQVEQDVARAALGLPARRVADLPLPAADRARLVGRYDLGPVQVDVYEQGEHLRARPTGQAPARLLYQGLDAGAPAFAAEHDPALRLRFQAGGDGTPALVLVQGGRALPPAARVSGQ